MTCPCLGALRSSRNAVSRSAGVGLLTPHIRHRKRLWRASAARLAAPGEGTCRLRTRSALHFQARD